MADQLVSKAAFRALRETVGLSQQDVADALDVRVLAVKRWEKVGYGEPPAAAQEWLMRMVEAHDGAVANMVALAEVRRDTDGVDEVEMTYYRDQAQYDSMGRADGPYGVANARARAVAETLWRDGFDVRYVYPDEYVAELPDEDEEE